MQQCTSCNKAIATIQVLDIEAGSVVNTQFLCEACAGSKGVSQTKSTQIQLSAQVLESLLDQASGTESAPGAVCPGCHLTLAEFKMRGRLGCSRCYDVFRPALLPLLERVHDAVTHRGRFPGKTATTAPRAANVAELRTRLADAISQERYEEAAVLRDALQKATEAEPDES
jgi:protein arginine kinase activator